MDFNRHIDLAAFIGTWLGVCTPHSFALYLSQDTALNFGCGRIYVISRSWCCVEEIYFVVNNPAQYTPAWSHTFTVVQNVPIHIWEVKYSLREGVGGLGKEAPKGGGGGTFALDKNSLRGNKISFCYMDGMPYMRRQCKAGTRRPRGGPRVHSTSIKGIRILYGAKYLVVTAGWRPGGPKRVVDPCTYSKLGLVWGGRIWEALTRTEWTRGRGHSASACPPAYLHAHFRYRMLLYMRPVEGISCHLGREWVAHVHCPHTEIWLSFHQTKI